MSNFYRDNSDIEFYIKNLDWERVVDLKEDGFLEKEKYLEAPKNIEDAIDNYDRVLEIVGDITGNAIALRAAEVDEEGAHFENGEVIYAKGTQDALRRLTQADLMGFTIPRKYGGLNMPKTVYSAAIEMVSRADASLMNLFGLQEIADTIYHFGSEDQKERFLPRFCNGSVTGSMALTEPDAGSDLQAVMLKATQSADGKWLLNGVKRFITNGCAQISLVMARSEDGSTDGRGISLFIYERDEKMRIRRIEHKLGIKGSPTCELQFNDAPAELLGQRRFGLIKYTMSLMNGARLGVSAQAIGVAEAAYREAHKYASDRVQFKKKIIEFPPVMEMLKDMRVSIEGGRALLYETSRLVDIKEGIEKRAEQYPDRAKDLKNDIRKYEKVAGFFTPLLKSYVTEMSNKVAYDALQIHGGVGYTTEFAVERLYRDARITNIYEGTTQLQVVAAIGGITSGLVFESLNEYENEYDYSKVANIFERAKEMRVILERAVSFVKEKNNVEIVDFHARRLVDMASDVVISYLLSRDAIIADRKKSVAELFISKAICRMQSSYNFIVNEGVSYLQKNI